MNRKWWVSEPGAELQRRDPPLCSEWEHHRPQRQHSALRQWRPSCAAGYFTRLWRHLQADTGRRTFIVAANGGRLTCLGGQWEKWDKPPRRGTKESCHQWRHLPRHHVYQLRGSATSMFLNQLSCLTSIAFLTQQFRSTFHHLWGELFLCGCETYQ